MNMRSCGSYNSGEEEKADLCLSSLALSPSSVESDESDLPPPPPPQEDVGSPSSFTSLSPRPNNNASTREDRTTQSHKYKNSQSSHRREDSAGDDQERGRDSDDCHSEDGKRDDDSTLFPESVRLDYSSISSEDFYDLGTSSSSHFDRSHVISTSSSVRTRLQPTNTSLVSTKLDPPARVNDALQTCSSILNLFGLRCAFDHWRREVNEDEILSCSSSLLSAGSIEVPSILDSSSSEHDLNNLELNLGDALSTIEQLVLKSVKNSAFCTLKSHMHAKRRFNEALVLLHHVIQQATVRHALYIWANTVWEQSMLETRDQRLLKKAFDLWRMLKLETEEMRQRLWQMTIFNRWRLITDESIELRQKEYMSLVHWANRLSKRAFVALSLHVKESKEEKRLANKSVDFSFGGRGQYVVSRYVDGYSNTAKSFIHRSPDANRTHVTRLGQSQTSNVPSQGNQRNIPSPSFRLRQPAGQRLSPPTQRTYLPSSKDYVSRGSGIVEQQQTIPRPSMFPSTGYYSQDGQYHNPHQGTDRRLSTTDFEMTRTSSIMMNTNLEQPIPRYQQQQVYHHQPVQRQHEHATSSQFSYNNNRSSHSLAQINATSPAPSLKSIRDYYQERFVISNLLDEMVTEVEQRVDRQYHQSANCLGPHFQPQPRTLHPGIASLFNR